MPAGAAAEVGPPAAAEVGPPAAAEVGPPAAAEVGPPARSVPARSAEEEAATGGPPTAAPPPAPLFVLRVSPLFVPPEPLLVPLGSERREKREGAAAERVTDGIAVWGGE